MTKQPDNYTELDDAYYQGKVDAANEIAMLREENAKNMKILIDVTNERDSLKAELEPWRAMERMIAEMQKQEPTNIELYFWHDGEMACHIEHEDCSSNLNGYWRLVAHGEGATLPNAVKAAYNQVMGVG